MSFHHTTRLFPGNLLEISLVKKGVAQGGAERRQPLDFCAFVSGKILILKVAGHLRGARSALFFKELPFWQQKSEKIVRPQGPSVSLSHRQGVQCVRGAGIAGMPPD